MKKPTVYLVDADHSSLEEMCSLLAGLDVKIELFTSAECFLRQERSDQCACLVANVALPGLSGLALIEQIKQRDMHLPTVLIDNLGNVTTAVQAIRAGVVDYIEKPFVGRILLKAVCDAINASAEADSAGPPTNP